MALIKCPECGKEISSVAASCPHCGYPINRSNTTSTTIMYETQVVSIRCWGRSSKSLNNKLKPYINAGWEILSMVEDCWLGGLASPVYKVTMRRPQKRLNTQARWSPKQSIFQKLNKHESDGTVWKLCPNCNETFNNTDTCPICWSKLQSVSNPKKEKKSSNEQMDKLNNLNEELSNDSSQEKAKRKTCPSCGEQFSGTNTCPVCFEKLINK